MFEKNDRALLTARIIIMVAIGILAVGSLAMGIALAVVFEAGVMFLTAFAGWFLCWLTWVFARLYLSYLCDIKLIRNKLYGECNEELEVFLKTIKEQEDEEKQAEIEEAKLALEELKENDMITEEEYEEQKKELLSKDR